MRITGLLALGSTLSFLLVAACGADSGNEFPDAQGGVDGSTGDSGNPGCNPACVSTLKCGAKGNCIAVGTCEGDADCGPGTICDLKTSTCVPGGGCGAQAIAADPVPPNMLVVLDRSCSMTDKVPVQTKWQIAVAALKTMTTTYAGKIRFGLTMFPDTDNVACTQAAIPVPTGPANESKIQTMLTSALLTSDPYYPDGPCVTNIDTAMSQAATDPGFLDKTRQNFAMLVTDGSQAGCNAGGGNAGTTATITAMAGKGVKTFVIGFGSGVNAAALNQFAVAGGVPVVNPTTKYYDAADQKSLDTALQTIAALTLSCTFKLGTVPPDPNKLFVFVDKKTQVSRDPNKTQGWDYDPVTNQVTLYGQVCTDLKAGTIKLVDIVYGCPEVLPN